MKRYFFIILLCSLIVSQTAAQTPFSSEIDSLVLRGIDLTFACLFDSAFNTYRKIIDKNPHHPIGYFYQATTLQSKMMDLETDRWEKEFYRLIDEAVRIGKKRLDEGDENPWTYFYLGSSYNYKGLYQVTSGGIVSGFISAQQGLGHLKKALEMDSTIYDAYLLLRNFDYWTARFYKYLQWLPWIRDEGERGVSRVRLAMERGTFSRWASVSSLGWIEYDRKNYEEAASLFQMGLEQYPGSRFFLWGLADTYFRLKKFDRAVTIYKELLSFMKNNPFNNGYNEIVLHFKLVRSYGAQGNYEEALLHCDAILNKKVIPEIEKRIEARREQTKKYRKECLKKQK